MWTVSTGRRRHGQARKPALRFQQHLPCGVLERDDPNLGCVLMVITTVAGNLTLVGSVANVIVAEGARDHYTLGFFEYLRFGAVSTALVLMIGVPLTAFWAPIALNMVK